MASGTASGSGESASVPSSLGSGAGGAEGATAVAASRSFGRPPLVSVRLGLFVLRRDAEREAVLGPERAAALHGERVRDRSARREAELHDDLAQRALRLLLHLENGRELLLADEPELGHQLAELALRHALSFGGGAHARFPTGRRGVTPLVSAQKASNLNTADPGQKRLFEGSTATPLLTTIGPGQLRRPG